VLPEAFVRLSLANLYKFTHFSTIKIMEQVVINGIFMLMKKTYRDSVLVKKIYSILYYLRI